MAYVLTYTNSFNDYVAMIQAKRSLAPLGLYGPYVVTSLLYLAFVVLGQLWDGMSLSDLLDPATLLVILAGVPLVILLVALINYFFLHGVYRLIFKRFALSNAELTIKLDEDGVHWSGNGFSGECLWSKVQRVVETKDRLFLFISKAEGLVLPRRALASDQEFEGLKAYVTGHVHG